jgi:cell wall assembly regulator SMI1
MLAETLRKVAGAHLVDEDGHESTLELLPPATEAEIAEAEAAFSVPLPTELREAMRVTAGFANGPIESLGFLDHAGFGMDDVFPNAYPLGHDGFGNYWVLDLLPDQDECGPVFYACHDPPVIALQSASASAFVREVVALHQPGSRSPVDVVHEDVTSAIWASNMGLMSYADASASNDRVLRDFAAGFAPEAVFADLRTPKVGDGFSWGRFGPRAEWTRAGAHRLWAIVPPERRGLLSRLFGRGGG